MRGIVRAELPDTTVISAPVSGIRLGDGEHGPVSMRLFRPAGTRVLVLGSVLPARLIAVRAASLGSAMRVISARDWIWTDVLAHSNDLRVVPAGQPPGRVPGACVVVDDRPAELRGGTELNAWECQLRLRSPNSTAELSMVSTCDLAIVSTLSAQLALSAVSAFSVPTAHASVLATLPPTTVAAIRRGRIEYVRLDPSPDEQRLLRM